MAVAQLVESRIVIPVVVGSSPISHPKTSKSPCIAARAFFFANTALAEKTRQSILSDGLDFLSHEGRNAFDIDGLVHDVNVVLAEQFKVLR